MKPPPSIPAEQEQRWIEAAGRGDQAAFESLIHLYEKKVFALTTRLCGNPEDAREAAQEAFLAVWQGLPAYRGDPLDKAGFDIRNHLLEARAVERCTRNAVINIKAIVFVAVVKCVALKDLFLVNDTVAVALQFIVTRQTAVQSGNSFDAHSAVRELKRGSGV